MSKSVVVATKDSWIEGEALRQLEQAAKLPGMTQAVGLPDLHPGKGIPVGAAFLSKQMIYPHLVGNDIGCGMGLWLTNQKAHKFKIDKAVNKLEGFEEPWSGNSATALEKSGLPQTLWPYALGTIGSGNHFAEFQTVESVINADIFNAHEMDKGQLYLLVHSGSRGLGESILRKHVNHYAGAGLAEDMEDFSIYIQRHDQAVSWAILNRQIIAQRFLDALGLDAQRKLDICHNSVTPFEDGWLHRKGAAPADKGLVVIPGSRGSLSYLVSPKVGSQSALHSLAHGAGRKWKRSDAKSRLSHRYKVSDLTTTKLGGRVICEDKALIYEEAPQAYKDISQVIKDMENYELIDVVATLKPIITYKTRRR